MLRIAWRSKTTGEEGHGEWVPDLTQEQIDGVFLLMENHPEFEYWVEYCPSTASE